MRDYREPKPPHGSYGTNDSAIQAVGLDIFGDCRREHIRTPIALLKTLPEIGRSDIFMDGLQQMDTALLVGSQAKRRELGKRKSRTADNDPFGKFQQTFRFMPTPQVKEAVGPDQVEEPNIGHRLVQRGKRLNGIVRGTVSPRCVQVGGNKAWVRTTGKLHHRQTVGEGG